MKTVIYHDEWTNKVNHMIKDMINITDPIEKAKKKMELAKYNVAYYEQYVTNKMGHSGSWDKIYEAEYALALRKLGDVRDLYYDLGLEEE